MFRAFINQCEGEIIAHRPSANPARTRARAELQPSQQSSEPTEESVQAAQEGNSPANGKKPFLVNYCKSVYPTIRFEYNLHTI